MESSSSGSPLRRVGICCFPRLWGVEKAEARAITTVEHKEAQYNWWLCWLWGQGAWLHPMQLPPSQISHLEEGKTVKLLLSMFGVLSREPNLSTWQGTQPRGSITCYWKLSEFTQNRRAHHPVPNFVKEKNNQSCMNVATENHQGTWLPNGTVITLLALNLWSQGPALFIPAGCLPLVSAPTCLFLPDRVLLCSSGQPRIHVSQAWRWTCGDPPAPASQVFGQRTTALNTGGPHKVLCWKQWLLI